MVRQCVALRWKLRFLRGYRKSERKACGQGSSFGTAKKLPMLATVYLAVVYSETNPLPTLIYNHQCLIHDQCLISFSVSGSVIRTHHTLPFHSTTMLIGYYVNYRGPRLLHLK